jgi:hypothetical protein
VAPSPKNPNVPKKKTLKDLNLAAADDDPMQFDSDPFADGGPMENNFF